LQRLFAILGISLEDRNLVCCTGLEGWDFKPGQLERDFNAALGLSAGQFAGLSYKFDPEIHKKRTIRLVFLGTAYRPGKFRKGACHFKLWNNGAFVMAHFPQGVALPGARKKRDFSVEVHDEQGHRVLKTDLALDVHP
jgi:hypothetical protein